MHFAVLVDNRSREVAAIPSSIEGSWRRVRETLIRRRVSVFLPCHLASLTDVFAAGALAFRASEVARRLVVFRRPVLVELAIENPDR